jgi:host factor-I protein
VKPHPSRSARPNRQLQNQQLAPHRANGKPIIVHLSNGVRLLGVIVAADAYALLLGKTAEDPRPQLVYKHTITSVTPCEAEIELAPGAAPVQSPDFVALFEPRTRARKRA